MNGYYIPLNKTVRPGYNDCTAAAHCILDHRETTAEIFFSEAIDPAFLARFMFGDRSFLRPNMELLLLSIGDRFADPILTSFLLRIWESPPSLACSWTLLVVNCPACRVPFSSWSPIPPSVFEGAVSRSAF